MALPKRLKNNSTDSELSEVFSLQRGEIFYVEEEYYEDITARLSRLNPEFQFKEIKAGTAMFSTTGSGALIVL